MGTIATEKINVLLVDDQPGKLLSYEVILAELGENLLKAGSATEALTFLLKNDVAVVLIDVCMPELDGFELARLMREHPRFEATSIIFVSAVFNTDLDLLRGYESGCVDYMPVPVVPELLRAKVRVFAELYRKNRELKLFNAELEARVQQRTMELAATNAELEKRVEQRTAEREAALAQIHEMAKLESIGKLTGGVAHDFNNLLTAILGNLEMLRARLPDEPKLLHLVDGAIRGAERGATLTSRMLAFARRQELKPQPVNVGRLVAGMLDLLRRSIGSTIDIRTDFPPSLACAKVDPNQLELALVNLAVNARDAMPNGGTIVLSAENVNVRSEDRSVLVPGDYVRITVTDEGVGMDADTLQRATEPFFTTKETGKGTGLGLSMVHGLAAQSKGMMSIKSEPRVGTSVDLWLPVAPSADEEISVPAAPQESAATRPRRILLVDDDDLVSQTTAEMLAELGCTVVEATSGARALEILQATPEIDLVITDHIMPGMSGTELARHIRKTMPHLPVILSTGYIELLNEDASGLRRLAKPFLPEDLANAIRDSTVMPYVGEGTAARTRRTPRF